MCVLLGMQYTIYRKYLIGSVLYMLKDGITLQWVFTKLH